MNVCMKYKMLEYDRIDISEGIDINKINASKENDICLCNRQDLMQKAMNFNDVAIAFIKESDYRIHFQYISKNDAINIMKK